MKKLVGLVFFTVLATVASSDEVEIKNYPTEKMSAGCSYSIVSAVNHYRANYEKDERNALLDKVIDFKCISLDEKYKVSFIMGYWHNTRSDNLVDKSAVIYWIDKKTFEVAEHHFQR